jgi:hypothetical protein
VIKMCIYYQSPRWGCHQGGRRIQCIPNEENMVPKTSKRDSLLNPKVSPPTIDLGWELLVECIVAVLESMFREGCVGIGSDVCSETPGDCSDRYHGGVVMNNGLAAGVGEAAKLCIGPKVTSGLCVSYGGVVVMGQCGSGHRLLGENVIVQGGEVRDAEKLSSEAEDPRVDSHRVRWGAVWMGAWHA